MKNHLKQLITNVISGGYNRLRTTLQNPYQKVGIGWRKMRFLKNLPSNEMRSVRLLDKPFFFNRKEDFLHSLKEIFVDHIYQQELKSKPYIIDCGANVGLSVIYLKELFPDATIVAFEPDEINFQLLKKNLASFGYSNVILKNEAIWNENTNLNFSSTGTLGSKIELNPNDKNKVVKAVRLKDLLEEYVDFLKIDIEGAEYAVLKDVGNHLSNAKNVFIEYHGTFQQNKELNEILELIVDNGFYYYIKEAAEVHKRPFIKEPTNSFDVQLNIFCMRSV